MQWSGTFDERWKASDAGNADAQAAISRGEEILDTDPRAALQCFEEALRGLPTNQTAWCNRGIAAAQLWEEVSAGERPPLLQIACESFRRVFTLDTSTRSEARYLAALACGKLLSRAAAAMEEEADTSGARASGNTTVAAPELIEALAEANRSFEEAFRLLEQWGHEAFDDECWGAWGEVLAQQMRVEISVAELSLPTSPERMPPVATLGETLRMDVVTGLCERAADKFTRATAAEVADPEDMDSGDDARWMTLHVELLLAFVEFIRKALSIPLPIELPLQAWGSKAETAWREAVSLADASMQLVGADAGWELFALRGDVFSAAVELLGTLSMRMQGPRLQLPDGQAAPAQMNGTWEAVGAPSYVPGDLVAVVDAVTHAEAAYAEALARGGQDAVAVVGLALGEMRLGRARHLHQESSSTKALSERDGCLQAAAQAFQNVTALRGVHVDKDSVATAWYNLACVAGLLGKAEHAAHALQLCFKKVQPNYRVKWASEARQDKDLHFVLSHPEVQRVLASP